MGQGCPWRTRHCPVWGERRHPAVATIAGDTIILKADGLDKPVACRYAFAGKPAVNLVNSENLPAYPFKTDDWAR